MDKTNYVLNKKPEPASNEIVWTFDLGHPLRPDRGEDRGEVSNPGHQKTAVRRDNEFLHKASLLIPAELALPRGRECCACLRRPRSRVLPRGETKTAAGRRRKT
jgi:hypothetical protein